MAGERVEAAAPGGGAAAKPASSEHEAEEASLLHQYGTTGFAKAGPFAKMTCAPLAAACVPLLPTRRCPPATLHAVGLTPAPPCLITNTDTFVSPLLKLGAEGKIEESTAARYLPEADTAAVLASQFDATYAAVKVRGGWLREEGSRAWHAPWTSRVARGHRTRRACVQVEQAAAARPCSPSGLLWRSYWRLYRWRILLHLAFTFCEIALRCGGPWEVGPVVAAHRTGNSHMRCWKE